MGTCGGSQRAWWFGRWCRSRWGGLFKCDFVECWENTGVVCTAIIHENAIDCLDPGGAVFVKRLGYGVGACGLREL